jgi:hypothetical protein
VFSHYHVVSVEKFLKSLLNAAEFKKIAAKLPKDTLEGLVNANYAVKLTRYGQELVFEGEAFPPMKLPRADDRIGDEFCNLIDDALLRLGLIYQCCFLMPDRYFGFDLILPVMLKDGTYTFIGIQFKAADVSVGVPTEKMQARFHYVKCPVAAPHGHCARCTHIPCSRQCEQSRCAECILLEDDHQQIMDKRKKLYADQICLLISLDPSDSKIFQARTQSSLAGPRKKQSAPPNTNRYASSSSRKRPRKPQLYSPLIEAKVELKAVLTSPNTLRPIDTHRIKQLFSPNFMKPLLSLREPFGPNNRLMLISSLWSDELVKFSADERQKGEFFDDGFVHRQYCIAVRGVDSFKHLFRDPKAVVNAQKLIAPDHHFLKNFSSKPDDQMSKLAMLKAIMYDANVNYIEYNHILENWRRPSISAAGTEPFGYRKLIGVSKTFYSDKIAQLSIARAHSSDAVKWIIDEDIPSKNPGKFEPLARELFPRPMMPPFYWNQKEDLAQTFEQVRLT